MTIIYSTCSSKKERLSLKNILLQLHPHLLGHTLHLPLNIIFHPAPESQKLSNLGKPEKQITPEQHNTEQQMPSPTTHPLQHRESGHLNQRARSPRPRNLNPVHRRPQELVIRLHDAQTPPDEDKLLRPFGLIREDLANRAPCRLLHFIMSLGELRLAQSREMRLRALVAAAVGRHERDGGEEVGVLHAPAVDDLGEGLVVEGEEGFPETRVLVSECFVHVDVEAVVD